jgi:hypothetical protein
MTLTLLALLGSPFASEWSEHELPQPKVRWEVTLEVEGVPSRYASDVESWLAEMARAEAYADGEDEGPRLVLAVDELQLDDKRRALTGALEVREGVDVKMSVPLDLSSSGRCAEPLRCLLVDSGPGLRSALANYQLKAAAGSAQFVPEGQVVAEALPTVEPAPEADTATTLTTSAPDEAWDEPAEPVVEVAAPVEPTPPAPIAMSPAAPPALAGTVQPRRPPSNLDVNFWSTKLTLDGDQVLRRGDAKMAVQEVKDICPPARRRFRAANIKGWTAAGFLLVSSASLQDPETATIAVPFLAGAGLLYALPPYGRSWVRAYNHWIVTPAGRQAVADLTASSQAMLDSSPVAAEPLPDSVLEATLDERRKYAESGSKQADMLPQLVTLASTDPAWTVRRAAIWSVARQCERGHAADPSTNLALSEWARDHAFGVEAEDLVEVANRGVKACK